MSLPEFYSRLSQFQNKQTLDHILRDIISGILSHHPSGPSLLDLAIQKDQPETVKYLLDHGVKFPEDSLLVHRCILNKQTEILKILLEKNHSVNNQDKNGATPLILAVQESDRDLIQFLLAKNPDLEIQDYEDYTALHWAYLEEDTITMKLLLVHGAKAPYHEYVEMACALGDLELFQLLIKSGSSYDPRYKNGMTPLLLAAEAGKFEIVEYLIDQGVNLYTKDKSGKNIVSYLVTSSSERKYPILEKLAKRGFIFSYYLMEWAAQNNDLDLIYFLVMHGVPLDSSLFYAKKLGTRMYIKICKSYLAMQKRQILFTSLKWAPEVLEWSQSALHLIQKKSVGREDWDRINDLFSKERRLIKIWEELECEK